MIVNVRGTSGSGKTTIIRSLMEELGTHCKIMVKGRKRPLAYVYERKPSVAIVGSYETACGGCDTINHYDLCYGTIAQLDNTCDVVIYEGLRQSGDVKRALELHNEGRKLVVVNLTTSLEECIESVRERRVARGASSDFNTTNTESKYRLIGRCNERLQEAGVEVYDRGRDEALTLVKEFCGVRT